MWVCVWGGGDLQEKDISLCNNNNLEPSPFLGCLWLKTAIVENITQKISLQQVDKHDQQAFLILQDLNIITGNTHYTKLLKSKVKSFV